MRRWNYDWDLAGASDRIGAFVGQVDGAQPGVELLPWSFAFLIFMTIVDFY
jgi:hypothetical protein